MKSTILTRRPARATSTAAHSRGAGQSRQSHRSASWEPTPSQLAAWEIHEADREEARRARRAAPDAANIGCTDEERRFWLGNRSALLKLVRSMPQQSGRQAFANAGCVGAILAVIASGKLTRDEIVHRAQERSRYSYQHIGFILGQLTGNDRDRHLWQKDASGHYRLHPVVRRSAAA